MQKPIPEYDNRYLRGVQLFNAGEYFEAHEVWEELWMECPSNERRFYQSLIQAAVALYHWGNQNRAGAMRLYRSGRAYMQPFHPSLYGLDVDDFWNQVGAALDDVRHDMVAVASHAAPAPQIVLRPEPATWPEPGKHHE